VTTSKEFKNRIVGSGVFYAVRIDVTRKQLCKHVPEAMNSNIIEEFLETVFSETRVVAD
jgi:hypothetical protein